MTVQLAPSVLNADLARPADEVLAVADVADWLHVDVMDGHFVPNLTLGLPVVESLVKDARLPIDCHLMIEDPDRWAPGYAERWRGQRDHPRRGGGGAGADAAGDQGGLARAGLAINPGTAVEPYAGWWASPHDAADDRRARVRRPALPRPGAAEDPPRPGAWSAALGSSIWLQVDGGVTEETIGRCAEAGANVFVAGMAVYVAADPAAAVTDLRKIATRAAGTAPAG